MKKIPIGYYVFTVFITFVYFMYHSACVHDNKIHADNDRVVAQMFSGNFEIKKFNTYDSKGAWLHGSFFLGCGSIDGGTTDEHMVSFCWKNQIFVNQSKTF